MSKLRTLKANKITEDANYHWDVIMKLVKFNNNNILLFWGLTMIIATGSIFNSVTEVYARIQLLSITPNPRLIRAFENEILKLS